MQRIENGGQMNVGLGDSDVSADLMPVVGNNLDTVDPRESIIQKYNELITQPPAEAVTFPKRRRLRNDIASGIERSFNLDVKTVLNVLYWESGISATDIAKLVNTTGETIRTILIENNIPIRTRGQAKIAALEQRKIDGKTPRMIEVEQRIGEEVGQALHRMYEVQKLGSDSIAQNLGVSGATVLKWLRQFGIRVRENPTISRDPEIEARRIKAVSRMWRDRGSEIVAKIHTPQAEANRTNALKDAYSIDTDAGRRRRQIASSRMQEVVLNRRRTKVGADVKGQLELMHYGEGLTIEEIAFKTGYSEDSIQKLMNSYGIKNITPLQSWFNKNAVVQNTLPLLWADPGALKNLTRGQIYILSRLHLSEGPVPTMDEVGSELGVTRQRVKQIEDSLLKFLSQLLKAQH